VERNHSIFSTLHYLNKLKENKMKHKLNMNPNTQEFKDFLTMNFEYFGNNIGDDAPDQALVWVFMLASFMVESLSTQEPEERKRVASQYLDSIHGKFQEAIDIAKGIEDDVGVPVNKRAI